VELQKKKKHSRKARLRFGSFRLTKSMRHRSPEGEEREKRQSKEDEIGKVSCQEGREEGNIESLGM